MPGNDLRVLQVPHISLQTVDGLEADILFPASQLVKLKTFERWTQMTQNHSPFFY
jgi:hypothetical protein